MSFAGRCLLLVTAISVLAGCDTASRHISDLPDPGVVVEAYNARVDELATVWSRVTVEARFEDDQGRRRWEQGNGYLQIAGPDRFALSVGKFGETLYWVGCDAQRYWLLDLELKRASTGFVDDAQSIGDARLGLPARPGELFALMGLRTLEPGGPASMRFVKDGIEFAVDERWGSTRYVLDEQRFEPRRVELVDATGDVVVSSTLSEYGGVRVPDRAGNFPRIASFVVIEDPGRESRVSLRLGEEGRERRDISDTVFDLEHLLDLFGIEYVDGVAREAG